MVARKKKNGKEDERKRNKPQICVVNGTKSVHAKGESWYATGPVAHSDALVTSDHTK